MCNTPATIHPFYFLKKITQTAAQPLYGHPEVDHSGSMSAKGSIHGLGG